MAGTVNLREIVLGILMEVTEREAYSHIALRNTLEKYQYLPKHDRAFISRVTEGTLENLIQTDYVIECFSKVPIYNMKPLIRNLLRMSVYQLKYMDNIPDSAVVNEAVRLAQKRGFYNLKGFVNGVLRAAAREMDSITYPSADVNPIEYLSVRYSMPQWILKKWMDQFSFEEVEKVCASFQEEEPVTVRLRTDRVSKEQIIASLEAEGVTCEQHPYLDYALKLSDFNYLQALTAFRNGWIYVQDVSSMLVAEAAAPNWGDYCIDVCAAPGGKSTHIADKLKGSGYVEARDKSEDKVMMMQENIDRLGIINMVAALKDATVFDQNSFHRADIVLCDVPCSGLGVIGRKQDIRYRMNPTRQEELVRIQRRILSVAQNYVKPGGVLIYSTCTIGADENQMNLKYFLENFPFRLDSIDPYIPEQLRCRTSEGGYIQLLPGVHETDGFFIARLKRYDE
jgi:16S rRNA (cytosine967-C5)-methyltransferase